MFSIISYSSDIAADANERRLSNVDAERIMEAGPITFLERADSIGWKRKCAISPFAPVSVSVSDSDSVNYAIQPNIQNDSRSAGFQSTTGCIRRTKSDAVKTHHFVFRISHERVSFQYYTYHSPYSKGNLPECNDSI